MGKEGATVTSGGLLRITANNPCLSTVIHIVKILIYNTKPSLNGRRYHFFYHNCVVLGAPIHPVPIRSRSAL